jgi:pilus assembly protein Flp/PilA
MVKSFVSGLLQFLQQEDGPNAVEYAVMLAMIIVMCVAAITEVRKINNWQFNRVAHTLGS